MSYMLKLKEWLPIKDAANYLSEKYKEPTSEADLFRFALDGHLVLSVRFLTGILVRTGSLIDSENERVNEVGRPKNLFDNESNKISLRNGVVIEMANKVEISEGIWDLTMLGDERFEIENIYQNLTDGPTSKFRIIYDGIILRRGNLFAQLQSTDPNDRIKDADAIGDQWDHPYNWRPTANFPRESNFVVRLSAIEQFNSRVEISNREVGSSGLKNISPIKSHAGGRPKSDLWPEWIAELAALVHEKGLPTHGSGSSGYHKQIIGPVADRLAERGLEAPGDTTVQDAAKAVMRRLRRML